MLTRWPIVRPTPDVQPGEEITISYSSEHDPVPRDFGYSVQEWKDAANKARAEAPRGHRCYCASLLPLSVSGRLELIEARPCRRQGAVSGDHVQRAAGRSLLGEERRKEGRVMCVLWSIDLLSLLCMHVVLPVC